MSNSTKITTNAETAMLRKNYRQSGRLKLDILSILPTDFAYFFFDGKCSEQVLKDVSFFKFNEKYKQRESFS